MMRGFAGKVLRVDLTSRTIHVDQPDEEFYRTYLGGAGFVSYYLFKEVPRGIDAFDPQNKLIFALGPMTGLAMPGATRNCVGAKSPLSGGYSKSEGGGFFPMALKKAGYDAVIVEGKADRPVYLLVSDQKVEILDASHLWGKTVLETQDVIAAELGEKSIRTAAIGPAGENLVRFACIMNDLKDAVGRGGLGAVMGSKNLKAIAASGAWNPELADPAKIRQLTTIMNKGYADNPLGFAKSLHERGTGGAAMMLAGNEIGNMPSHNFGVNSFEGTAKVTANAVLESYGVGMEACAACGVRCKKVVEISEPWSVNRRNGGPEYESLVALGPLCGVDNLASITKANELANLYGLDSISLGVSIGFGMECFENGILTTRDTDGIELKFGNAEAMLQTVEMITHRRGVGDLLAEGTKRAAEKLGRGADAFAMHVKGLEIPMHEPRVKQGLGLIYAVEAQGADHCAGMHDTGYTMNSPGFEHLRGMGATRPLPANDLSDEKVASQKASHLWNLFLDSVVCCQFVPWSVDELAEIVRAVTGWSYTTYEAVRLGERVATLGRLFNLREGITSAQDNLPKRMFGPTRAGALKSGGIDPEKFDHAVRTFYAMMGWDEDTGVPTRGKMLELGIGWAVEDLPAAPPTP
ncbi:MAG: aldehyde ferredoxin oxidoreductase family protein [bacterium]|nr:aldehyde ferredoxin oxidoreductase family protein [bacterium]